VRIVYPLVSTVQGNPLTPLPITVCLSDGAARAGYLVEAQSLGTSGTAATRARVIGIAPDGVTSMTLISRGRPKRINIPVTRNAYEAIVAKPVAVRFVVPLGHRSIARSIPLKLFSTSKPAPHPNALG